MSVRRSKSEKGQSDRLGTEIVNSGSLVAKKVGSGLESLLELWFHHLKIVISGKLLLCQFPELSKILTITATLKRGFCTKYF